MHKHGGSIYGHFAGLTGTLPASGTDTTAITRWMDDTAADSEPEGALHEAGAERLQYLSTSDEADPTVLADTPPQLLYEEQT